MKNNNSSRERVFDFIVKFDKENGYTPSIREISAGVSLSSTQTIHHHLKNLQNDGLIMRKKINNRISPIIICNKK